MADNQTVSIIMDVTDSSRNKRQKAITNVNPEATNNELLNFANAVNALTVDTLDKVTRVEKKELSAESYWLFGATELVTRYNSNPSDGTVSSYYEVADGNGSIQSATIAFTVGDYDTAKAHVTAETTEGEFGSVSYIEFYTNANEAVEVPVTVSAAGDFGSLSKTVRLVGLKGAE